MPDRREVRAALLQRRAQLNAGEIRLASDKVARLVLELPAVSGALRIAAYRAVRGELDAGPVVEWAWKAGRRVYLPVTQPPRDMTFARWRTHDHLTPSTFGIDEPLPSARRISVRRLDAVLVPLVAFDRKGNRIGQGAGYYDAAFAFRLHASTTRPVLVGLAHAFQEVDAIDTREWDVPLDFVVTDESIIDCTIAGTR